MKETVWALSGRRHCGWCIDRPPTWWDRLMRFDQAMRTADRPWWERVAMKVSDFNVDALQAWRLGRWWHVRYHR
jgi:hypothetical protein